MDVAFNRLGILKDCGHELSLFSGSFDEQAGAAIIQNECWETYLKHSLVNSTMSNSTIATKCTGS